MNGITEADRKHANLLKWARICSWNCGTGNELKTYPIRPVETADGGHIWKPKWDGELGEWHLGFEWDEPRDISGVIIGYTSADCINGKLRMDYWNTSWPTPSPERWQGARRGWIKTEEPWHGEWKTVRGELITNDLIQKFIFDPLDIAEINKPDELEMAEDFNVCFRRTLKLRLAFKGMTEPSVNLLYIKGAACRKEGIAEIRFGCFDDSLQDWSGEISIWNGEILKLEPLGFAEDDELYAENKWKCIKKDSPKGLRVKFIKYHNCKAAGDRTLISLRTSVKSFTFLPDDLEKGAIWIEPYNVLVSGVLPKGDWEGEIGKTIRKGQSIYERISDEPEQTYARASNEIPELDVTKQSPYGRYTILGWEGIRQKFALRYNGEVFAEKQGLKIRGRDASKIRWGGNSIHFRFATGDPADFRMRSGGSKQEMQEPQLPVYLTKWEDREIEYTQTCFGTLMRQPAAGLDHITGKEELVVMMRITFRNTVEENKNVYLWIDINPSEKLIIDNGDVFACGRIIPSETVKYGWKVQNYDEKKLRLHLNMQGGEAKVCSLTEGRYIGDPERMRMDHRVHIGKETERIASSSSIEDVVLYTAELPGYGSGHIDINIPFSTYSSMKEQSEVRSLSFDRKLEETRHYWNGFHSDSAKIQLPEKIIEDFFKAVPWHILFTAARNPETGDYVLPAATYNYGACGNEACMQIRLLDMLGYHEYAERYLDTFLRTQGMILPEGNFKDPEGALGALDFDAEKVSNSVFAYNLDHGFILACLADHYILTGDIEWLKKVSHSIVDGCDFILRERKRTMQNGESPASFGLLPAGRLEDNREWRHWFAVNAHAFGGMIKAALALRDIRHPEAERIINEALLYKKDIGSALERAMEEAPVVNIGDGTYIPHIPTRTGIRGRERGWFREAAHGPLHLVDGGICDEDDEKTTWILKDLEDNLFMSREYGRAADKEKYWFSRGGVTIQANLLNNGPVYMMRDQLPHAVRALYNNFCQHIYPDVLVFTEHPVVELGHGAGPFFKTPDESQFLVWVRSYLIMEEEPFLWLCRGVPRHWLGDGKAIRLKDMPTAFGTLDCNIESNTRDSLIRASIKIPERKETEGIYLCLHHPEEKEIKSVFVNGGEYHDFNTEKEYIFLKGFRGTIDITVNY